MLSPRSTHRLDRWWYLSVPGSSISMTFSLAKRKKKSGEERSRRRSHKTSLSLEDLNARPPPTPSSYCSPLKLQVSSQLKVCVLLMAESRESERQGAISRYPLPWRPSFLGALFETSARCQAIGCLQIDWLSVGSTALVKKPLLVCVNRQILRMQDWRVCWINGLTPMGHTLFPVSLFRDVVCMMASFPVRDTIFSPLSPHPRSAFSGR